MISEAGELLQERQKYRRPVIRQAVIYTPGSIVVLGLLSISVASLIAGNWGALIPIVILGLVAMSITFQAIAALRDLFAEPVTTTGPIRRAWTKGLWFGIFRFYYVLVGRAVFDISIVAYHQVEEGDRLEITHWPHTKAVITVRKFPSERMSDGPRSPRDPGGGSRDSVDAAIGRMQAGSGTFGGPVP